MPNIPGLGELHPQSQIGIAEIAAIGNADRRGRIGPGDQAFSQ